MRESLLTIPINEVFEPRCGCPICNMRNSVEEHICEYIMGAAMMEPDVREETNELGFCLTHFNMLLKQNNRLSLALMLNTHISQLREEVIDKKDGMFSKGAKAKKISEMKETCFVCSKVEWGVNHMLETVFTMFKNDESFRKLYSKQEYLCIPHYRKLMTAAQSKLKKDDLKAFCDATDELVGNYAKSLNSDVKEFCDSFDYRNAGKLHNEDMEHVRSSIERAIEFLTSRKPSEK
ncbi:MAG: hypothetical protein J6C38_06615 [Oscillospiraceae bacterium]|nr:hypothetical protein [Oscillospiraceae bacterium]